MNFVSFLCFSTLENIVFFYFLMVLFRFNIKEHMIKFIVFSVVLSFVSNTLQIESMRAVAPLILATLLILFVSFLLRVHLFNSMVMVITCYVINYMVQWSMIGASLHFSGNDAVLPYTSSAYLIQSASAAMMACIAFVTSIQKSGFSFINHDSRFSRTRFFSKKNRPFAVFIVLSLLLIFIAQFLITIAKKPPYLPVAVFLLAAFIGLLYICVKRDGVENG